MPPNTSPTLMHIPPAEILVREGFNVRSNGAGLDGLVASIERNGVLVPLVVRDRPDQNAVELIAGHRRLAAAVKAGIDTVPVVVRDDANNEDGIVAELAATENVQRAQLTPLEEARAFGAMIDRGYTKKGVAEALGVSQKLVTERLRILELPAEVHDLVDQLRLSIVPVLADLAAFSEQLATIAARLAVDDANDYTISHWVNHPLSLAQRAAAHEDATGLFPLHQIPHEDLELPDDVEPMLAELAEHFGYDGHVDVALWREDVQRLHTAGVALIDPESLEPDPDDVDEGDFYEADWYGNGICNDPVLLADVVADRIRKDHADLQESGREQPAPGGVDADYRAQRAKEAKRRREEAVRARGMNLDLGRKLLDGLAAVSLDKDVATFLAYTLLSNAYGPTSASTIGARLGLVLPEWQQVKQGDDGEEVTYPGHSADKRVFEFLDAAKTAEELLGRVLVAYAAAHFARPDAEEGWWGGELDSAVPDGHEGRAVAALEKLVDPHLPKALKNWRANQARKLQEDEDDDE